MIIMIIVGCVLAAMLIFTAIALVKSGAEADKYSECFFQQKEKE